MVGNSGMFRAPVFLLLVTLAANALAEEIVRIGVSTLPIAHGTPYSATNIPTSIPAAAIFDSLTILNNQGELKPWLATAWHAKNELTWIINLRGNIQFSNGEPFDANAVIAALEYARSPEGLRFAIARELRGIISARATGPLTVELRTREPDAMLPRSLAGLRIAAPGHFRKLGAKGFRLDPVGTGPFKVVTWESNRVRMVANIGSWRRPRVDSLELLVIPEQSARLQALQSGVIDIAIALGPDDEEMLAQIGARMHRELVARVLTLAFITVRESPLSDPRVRLALNHAVNRQLIIDTILAGATEPAIQAAPKQAFGYDPDLTAWPYDPDRAKALLSDAGYPDGFEMLATVTTGNAAADQQVYQAIAVDLGRVGVNLKLQRISSGTLYRYFYDGNWPGLAFSMDYSTEPSLDALRPFLFHSCLWSKPFHCDEEILPLIVAARHEFDLDKRRELVRQILRHHHQAPPGILLWQLPRFDGLAARIQNYRTIPGALMLHEIDLRNPL